MTVHIHTNTNEEWAVGLLEKLQEFADGDEPQVYKDYPRAWAYDTGADFPWNSVQSLAVYQLLWAMPEFAKVNESITAKLVDAGVIADDMLAFPEDEESYTRMMNM